MNLIKNVKVTKIAGWNTTATTDVSPLTRVDMAGYQGVMFIGLLGKIDASDFGRLVPQHAVNSTAALVSISSTAFGGGWAGNGTTGYAGTEDDKCLVVDVCRPTKRYVSCLFDRSTVGASELDSIVAIQYGPTEQPVVQDSTGAYGTFQATQLFSPTTA